MKRLSLPAVLGLAHAVADGSAGLILGGLPARMDLGEVALLVLLYNVLAFGAQPLVGMLVDQMQRPRAAVLGGMGLLAAGLLTSGANPLLAVFATPERSTGPGLFAAPGVVGLAVGGALMVTEQVATWPFLGLLALFGAAVLACRAPSLPYDQAREKEPILESHDLIMMLLLASIALRSAVWSTVQFALQGRTDMLVYTALAAACGKGIGGLLADRFGWRRYALGALALAAPLLAFGGGHPAALLPGVALLQSATPVALTAVVQRLPHRPATAAGLALGLAIAVGGLPSALGPSPPLIWLGIAVVAAALALYKGITREHFFATDGTGTARTSKCKK